MFLASDEAIELILELHDAVAIDLGPDAVDAAYADISFAISTRGAIEKIPGTMITRLESHHNPRALLAIIERDGKETVRVALGEHKAEHVTSKLITMLAAAYKEDPSKTHLKQYFKMQLVKDLNV
ncbi:hypothetical protein N7335_02020 [Stutzerimonas stutzeri]|uniref:Uncharacterized protein n=1 Tax=Stutzerimonas stutzeri TaxID=316 RepID=A0AA42H3T7_STUST|nr:hypothetical protein [Stutzerimonas stutzeri]MDH0145163.1 hypothetical protein [Stutzerimonas stutzeri]MDH0149582.1 hypothetical protein [Stutzerimonas stutzeri]